MTERKWTPGPWYIDGYNETRDGGYVEVKSEKFHWVCSVTDYSDGTAKPNAHLIAAAPDLYEALEVMRHEYRTALRISGVDEKTSKTMATANAALAKARGVA